MRQTTDVIWRQKNVRFVQLATFGFHCNKKGPLLKAFAHLFRDVCVRLTVGFERFNDSRTGSRITQTTSVVVVERGQATHRSTSLQKVHNIVKTMLLR
jgi:hypothetical protein